MLNDPLNPFKDEVEGSHLVRMSEKKKLTERKKKDGGVTPHT
jgi:hypothetical protein